MRPKFSFHFYLHYRILGITRPEDYSSSSSSSSYLHVRQREQLEDVRLLARQLVACCIADGIHGVPAPRDRIPRWKTCRRHDRATDAVVQLGTRNVERNPIYKGRSLTQSRGWTHLQHHVETVIAEDVPENIWFDQGILQRVNIVQ